MPSPFPGMDPYIEERSRWPDFQLRMIYNISEALQQQVRPKYIARIGERTTLEPLGKDFVPDVVVVEPPRQPPATQITTGAPVSLSKAEEEWMAALLCEKGLQTAPAEQ